MKVVFYQKISKGSTRSINRFIAKNFYKEGEPTPKLLADEKEKFYSKPKAWILAFEEDQIVGTTALHQRRIQFNNQDINLGGIGRVCTHKDRRRQGIAASMLEEAVKTLKGWGCDIAYLCADVKESRALYEKAGFVRLSQPYTYHGRSGKLYEEKNGMIAALNSRGLFEEILASKQKLHLGPGNW